MSSEILHIPTCDILWQLVSQGVGPRTRLFQRVGHEDADEKVDDLFMVFLSCRHPLVMIMMAYDGLITWIITNCTWPKSVAPRKAKKKA